MQQVHLVPFLLPKKMPFPNFHSARIKDPKQFDLFRTSKNQFGDGIDAIFGIKDVDVLPSLKNLEF